MHSNGRRVSAALRICVWLNGYDTIADGRFVSVFRLALEGQFDYNESNGMRNRLQVMRAPAGKAVFPEPTVCDSFRSFTNAVGFSFFMLTIVPKGAFPQNEYRPSHTCKPGSLSYFVLAELLRHFSKDGRFGYGFFLRKW